MGWIIFSQQQYKIPDIPKRFKNVQLFSINFLINFLDWIIFSKQQYKIPDIPKKFKNVQLFSINPIKCLNFYADNWTMNFIKTAFIFDWRYTMCQWRMLKNYWNTLKISLFGQTTNTSNFEGRSLTLVTYKKMYSYRERPPLSKLYYSTFDLFLQRKNTALYYSLCDLFHVAET